MGYGTAPPRIKPLDYRVSLCIMGGMTLDEYLKKAGQTDAEFAKSVGVTRGYITNLRNGTRKGCSLDVALRIQLKSGGFVPVYVWGTAPPDKGAE